MTTPAEEVPVRNPRRLIATLLGLGLSIGLLYWILRSVSLANVVEHLRAARAGPLAAAVVLATLTFGLRVVRWRILLRTDTGGTIRWSALWHATAMGFMANNTLPFRLGEFFRAYAAGRLGGVPVTAAFASIAVERALDALVLVGLLIVALFGAGLPGDTVVYGTRLDTVVQRAELLCVGVFAGALFVLVFPVLAERLVRLLIPFRRPADRVVNLIEGLRVGFGALKSPSRLVAAVFWSVAHWLLNAAAFYVGFAAFNIHVGFAGALLLQSLLAIGVAAPSTPGYFGVFEAVTAAALLLFGVPTAVGFAYGITYHITTFVPITLLGLWSLARTGLHVGDAQRAAP